MKNANVGFFSISEYNGKSENKVRNILYIEIGILQTFFAKC